MGSRYLAGWEVDFRSTDETVRFLKTQGVNKKDFDFFRKVQGALELKVHDTLIKKLYEHHDYGDGIEKTLLDENIPLPLQDWPEHEVFFLQKSNEGNHRLGGKKPSSLKLPVSPQSKLPFQYLGTIDGTDESFSWLNVRELHLVYPLYECNFGIYLDYSDPVQPKILEPITLTDDWKFDDLELRAHVEFMETRYQCTKKVRITDFLDEDSDDILLCGVPLWIQQPEIPVCPVTGECMNFVCTLHSDFELKVSDQVLGEKMGSDASLSFGDHGHLYIFYHPGSKVMHLRAQW
ncbi:hypothetical protein [Paenibacillus hexagrammi]|uniref:Uncharacterized protein n=1 Tax=Paenibacillus hexagrammi TaxID=2908839 RepID=A0ABY3SIP2_9BACL|nr:hypothetical protein [Paenibacillus sp. YPD9-1]UJF33878.1 hypothetical protein L0M14_01045 [Paenibacillus sp. YPD9-1]